MPAEPSTSAVLPTGNRQVFNLDALVKSERRSRLITSAVFVVIGLVLFVLGVSIALEPVGGGHTQSGNDSIGGVLMVFGAMIFVVSQLPPRPSLVRIEVGNDDLVLVRANGTRAGMKWSDPRLGITMFDYAPDPLSTKSEKERIRLRTSIKWSGSISREASAGIAKAAHLRGLPVLVRDEAVPGGKVMHKVTATRIGSIEFTPN